jgi:hypothetical protein
MFIYLFLSGYPLKYNNISYIINKGRFHISYEPIINEPTVSKCAARNPDATTSTSLSSTELEEFRVADIVIIALLGSLCIRSNLKN